MNAEGEGPSLETEQAITAKDPFSRPNPPVDVVIDVKFLLLFFFLFKNILVAKKSLEFQDYDNKSATLSWTPGASNGAEITGYTVEMQVKGERDWVPVSEVGSKPETTVKNLEEGAQVRFRVKARNRAGFSDPSEPCPADGWHTVRFKNLKPHIDRTNLTDVTIKVGRTLHLEAAVAGEPPATVTWHGKEDKILSIDKHISINSPDYFTEITIDNIQRKHAGPLTVKAVNRNGEDSVTIVSIWKILNFKG